eukprot:m.11661 g.11661  ORF g.11661 m.11661 type:complete len:118 (-) comp3867_c0_seq2:1367-1720(-)
MSFLRSSFNKKKSSSRSASLTRKKKKKSKRGDDDEDSDWGTSPISLTLGNHHLQYEHGRWTSDSAENETSQAQSSSCKTCAGVDVKKLQEENRLLKFKIEVLVDMLTLARAENESKS